MRPRRRLLVHSLPSNSSNSDLKSAPLLLKDITFDVNNAWRYAFHVIRALADKETEKLFVRDRSRALPKQLQRVALRKLLQIDAAESLSDLRTPPGNRLERLRGNRKGQHSIRINDQWRICFVWEELRRAGGRNRRLSPRMNMGKKILEPIHPGEILLEDFLVPLRLSQYRLAKGISVPPRRINEIVHGKRSISADTALRLSRFFGTSERFWLNLQNRYDLEVEKDRLGKALDEEVEILSNAGS